HNAHAAREGAARGMEVRYLRLWNAWVWLAASQIPFCGCFVLHPRQAAPARPGHKPAECYRSAAAVPHMRCSPLQNHNPLLSRPQGHLRPRPAAGPASAARRRTLQRPIDLPLPSTRRSGRTPVVTWLSGEGNGPPDRGGSGAAADHAHGSSTATDVAVGDETAAAAAAAAASAVRAETERLMSVPTIDIKLELQMRGVEHRDAFEKIDLARRL
ncbi:unnamed protein product, partial [Scytosiphon promiscuus]